MAENALYGKYIRGKLALAGLDLSAPVDIWLDAVYTVWADLGMASGFEVLDKLATQVIQKSAQVRPEEARDTWGTLPEHRALASKRAQAMGMGGGQRGAAPAAGPRPRPGG